LILAMLGVSEGRRLGLTSLAGEGSGDGSSDQLKPPGEGPSFERLLELVAEQVAAQAANSGVQDRATRATELVTLIRQDQKLKEHGELALAQLQALVEDAAFQELVERSNTQIEKMMADPTFEGKEFQEVAMVVSEQLLTLINSLPVQERSVLFAEQMNAFVMHPQVQELVKLAAEHTNAIMGDHDLQEHARLVSEQMEALMDDPHLEKKVELFVEQVSADARDETAQRPSSLVEQYRFAPSSRLRRHRHRLAGSGLPAPSRPAHNMAPPVAVAPFAVGRGGDAMMAADEEPRPGPPGLFDKAVALGAAKSNLPLKKMLALGIVSGGHIALGSLLAVSVGGMLPGIKADNPGLQKIILGLFGLPMGLFMTVAAGGELVTGNFASVSAAYYEGQTKLKKLLKNWSTVLAGNFIGSVLVAKLATLASTGVGAPAASIALAKTSAPFLATFAKAILANWIVSMAVWIGTSTPDIPSKVQTVALLISGFVAMGLEHCVANMFLIPFGMMQGAGISVADMFTKNLIPATLGNAVGGAFFTAYLYDLAYGKGKGQSEKTA